LSSDDLAGTDRLRRRISFAPWSENVLVSDLPILLSLLSGKTQGVATQNSVIDTFSEIYNARLSDKYCHRYQNLLTLPSMHNLLTVKETAKYLRIPLPTVYYLVQRGQLPAIQIGGRWRIKKDSLDKDVLKEDRSGQPTVLVVDDDLSLQNLFKVFLKKIGFSRVVVGTVKEAIAALEKQRFDILFLDLKLPDGPADDVYEAAKEIDPQLPIVVITGYPDSDMLNRILAKGPITVLKKPLKVDQLKQTVRILGHKEATKLAA
jgi:excisionase family DNA binding protein